MPVDVVALFGSGTLVSGAGDVDDLKSATG